MIGAVDQRAPAAAASAGTDEPARIAEAAREFEALLIATLLKSMQGSGAAGCFTHGEDSGPDALVEFAQEQMARLLAAQGGLGLAQLVTRGLEGSASEGRTRASAPSSR